MSRIGFVTALVDEAQTLTGSTRPYPGSIMNLDPDLERGRLLIVSGIGAARAARAARALLTRGASALVSWGTAGGLSAGLSAGSLIVPSFIVDSSGQRFMIDAEWRRRLLSALPQVQAAESMLSSDAPLGSVAAKTQAHKHSGADAVDMESAAIAAIARDAALPFIAVRAIVDCSTTSLPDAALAAMDEDGRLRPARMMRALSRAPKDLMRLARLAPKFAAARASLKAAAGCAPLMYFP